MSIIQIICFVDQKLDRIYLLRRAYGDDFKTPAADFGPWETVDTYHNQSMISWYGSVSIVIIEHLGGGSNTPNPVTRPQTKEAILYLTWLVC